MNRILSLVLLSFTTWGGGESKNLVQEQDNADIARSLREAWLL
jgi:hypothetical protein